MKGSAILLSMFLGIFTLPALAEGGQNGQNCLKWSDDTVTNSCSSVVTVAWCYPERAEKNLRCNTGAGNYYPLKRVLRAGQAITDSGTILVEARSVAACKGFNSLIVTPGGKGKYSCK